MARQTEEGPDADAFIHTCLAGARRLGVVDRLARAARFAALRERCAARVVERTLRRCGACTCAAKVIQQRWAKALRERRRGDARLRNHPWAEALGVAAEKDAAEVVTTWGDRASDAAGAYASTLAYTEHHQDQEAMLAAARAEADDATDDDASDDDYALDDGGAGAAPAPAARAPAMILCTQHFRDAIAALETRAPRFAAHALRVAQRLAEGDFTYCTAKQLKTGAKAAGRDLREAKVGNAPAISPLPAPTPRERRVPTRKAGRSLLRRNRDDIDPAVPAVARARPSRVALRARTRARAAARDAAPAPFVPSEPVARLATNRMFMGEEFQYAEEYMYQRMDLIYDYIIEEEFCHTASIAQDLDIDEAVVEAEVGWIFATDEGLEICIDGTNWCYGNEGSWLRVTGFKELPARVLAFLRREQGVEGCADAMVAEALGQSRDLIQCVVGYLVREKKVVETLDADHHMALSPGEARAAAPIARAVPAPVARAEPAPAPAPAPVAHVPSPAELLRDFAANQARETAAREAAERAAAAAAPPPAPVPEPPTLPHPWQAFWDARSERYYFGHPTTGQVQWDMPVAAPPPPPPPVRPAYTIASFARLVAELAEVRARPSEDALSILRRQEVTVEDLCDLTHAMLVAMGIDQIDVHMIWSKIEVLRHRRLIRERARER